jgi:hypothetical protein
MTEYRTTDTDELAPHPDMTSDDLRDFEAYCDDVSEFSDGDIFFIVLVALAVIGALVMLAVS